MFGNIIFRQLFDTASSTYSYVVGDPRTLQAVIIDTVFEQYFRDRALVEELGLKLLAVLDTHCHADHVTGAWLMQQATGCRIGISKRYGAAIEGADLRFDHGDRVAFGERYLEVRATPGHTDGCVTYVTDDHRVAFTGDCLLIRGAGRCDFQQGNASALYRSITEQIFSLPDDSLIFPGHDYSGRTMSSVGEERAHNPRIGGHADERDFVGFMENLNLPHPKQIDVAVPANLRCGKKSYRDPRTGGRCGGATRDCSRSTRSGSPSISLKSTCSTCANAKNWRTSWATYPQLNVSR